MSYSFCNCGSSLGFTASFSTSLSCLFFQYLFSQTFRVPSTSLSGNHQKYHPHSTTYQQACHPSEPCMEVAWFTHSPFDKICTRALSHLLTESCVRVEMSLCERALQILLTPDVDEKAKLTVALCDLWRSGALTEVLYHITLS